MSTNHNLFLKEERAEALSNRGPSAYEPNALLLGQTCILDWQAALAIYRSSGGRWVNMHIRCRVWQAQILDVIRCHLLLEHPCDVYKNIRHENANLLKYTVVFLSFTT